jgi:hypothetical protein
VDTKAIWWPAAAMAFLTFAVAIRMFRMRIGQIKREKIRLSTIATSSAAAERLTDSRGADNYRNLFELPVLFYLALVVASQNGQVNTLTLILAWAFVAARFAHSFIQTTYNKVIHRFYAFVASFFICAVLWLVLAIGMAMR